MSATIFLARHGSHDEVGRVLSGRSDIGLNVAGRGEAERLADRLDGMSLAAVYASPQWRARQTAEIVAARHDMSVSVLDGLDEIDFGGWAGQPFVDLAGDPAWQRWNAARGTAATPAAETMASVTARAITALADVAGDVPVLCVSHCDVIRGVVAHVLGLDAGRLLAFALDCGSLTTVARDDGDWRLLTLNERPR